MLVLFETAKGYAIFKLHDEKKLERVDKLAKVFQKSESKLNKVISLHHFERFESTADAVKCAVSIQDAKLGKILKKTIKKSIIKQELTDEIAVADHKLGSQISKKFNINCQSSAVIQELMYLIRSRADDLIPKLEEDDDKVMQLGVSHGIGRYKIKFSPEKVDIMIIQAVSLLDELDKELNNYIMRCREWYGWHFPELSKIIPPPNHLTYVKVILAMGMRTSATDVDLSELIEDEETIVKVKEYAEISMGTDITEEDLENIKSLCENIVELCEYRTQLFEYLRNRMMTIAPNLTVLVGELVGARLISHAGSLMNLAKHPASTVQILGAEKALFRALKTKHDTPKYGLIYHAQLVGQSSAAMKGKMSRCLAAKASLAIRSDAFGENPSCEMAMEHRAKLEAKLQVLEQTSKPKMNGSGKKRAKPYENVEHRSKKVKLDS